MDRADRGGRVRGGHVVAVRIEVDPGPGAERGRAGDGQGVVREVDAPDLVQRLPIWTSIGSGRLALLAIAAALATGMVVVAVPTVEETVVTGPPWLTAGLPGRGSRTWLFALVGLCERTEFRINRGGRSDAIAADAVAQARHAAAGADEVVGTAGGDDAVDVRARTTRGGQGVAGHDGVRQRHRGAVKIHETAAEPRPSCPRWSRC